MTNSEQLIVEVFFGLNMRLSRCLPVDPQIASASIPVGGSGWLAVTDDGNRRVHVQVVTLTFPVISATNRDLCCHV